MTDGRNNGKRWLWLIGIVVMILIAVVTASHSRAAGSKIVMVNSLELQGLGSAGPISSTHFRFRNHSHRLIELTGGRMAWNFTILTNDRAGNFTRAFAPVAQEFRTPDGGEFYEFWLRDRRLIDCEWKIRVTRSFSYPLPASLSVQWHEVRTPAELWESDIMRPSLGNWKWESGAPVTPFRFSEHPLSTNHTPAFLTDEETMFGDRGLHYPQ